METGRNAHNSQNGHSSTFTIFPNNTINMSSEPMVNRQIPLSPELSLAFTVPPLFVKQPISKSKYFSQNIEFQVEKHNEVENPKHCTRNGQRKEDLKQVYSLALSLESGNSDQHWLDILFINTRE